MNAASPAPWTRRALDGLYGLGGILAALCVLAIFVLMISGLYGHPY
jgi:hypothetical protein